MCVIPSPVGVPISIGRLLQKMAPALTGASAADHRKGGRALHAPYRSWRLAVWNAGLYYAGRLCFRPLRYVYLPGRCSLTIRQRETLYCGFLSGEGNRQPAEAKEMMGFRVGPAHRRREKFKMNAACKNVISWFPNLTSILVFL